MVPDPDRSEELFLQARKLESEQERAHFLDQSCGEDTALRSEVDSLLENDVPDSPLDHGLDGLRIGQEDAATTRSRSRDLQSLLDPLLDESLGTQADAVETPAPSRGRLLGDFRILGEIGRGGMGIVYEAEQISLGRKVALKVLSGHLSLSQHSIKRFRREAAAGARQRHPGIVGIYAYGEENEVPYIAQELVAGGVSMADRLAELRRQPEIPVDYYEQAAELFLEIADALGAAHEAGVIHRDIKPGNILLTQDLKPKITDFGLASVEDALNLSRTGEFAGTPFYMSPEQAASRRMGIDERTDIFSFGATFYEYLTLRRPFDGDTSQQVIEKILLEDPPEPRRLRSRVPRDLSIICMKALEKRREDRYQSMHEFALDLQRFLENVPIKARPTGAGRRMQKWVLRHPTASLGITLVSVALVVILFLFDRTAKARREAEDQSRRYLQQAQILEKREEDIQRLYDRGNLAELRSDATRLWPAHPRLVPRYEEWLRKSLPLRDQLQAHEKTLAELEGRALPPTAAETAQDRRNHPRADELVAEQGRRKHLQDDLDELRNEARRESWRRPASATGKADWNHPQVKELREQISISEARIAALEEVIGHRRTWRFKEEGDRWLHREFSRLVQELREFADPKLGTIRDIEQRLGRARTLERRSIIAYRREWQECIDAVATHPVYRGLVLTPQIGLVPLPPADPRSGLWEFWLVDSGQKPTRHQGSGVLEVSTATGIVLVLIPGGQQVLGSQSQDPSDSNYDPMSASSARLREREFGAFLMAKYEVTQGQWAQVMGNWPSFFSRGREEIGAAAARHPVEQVNWNDCQEFMFRQGLELPTEDQWEYAARAGTAAPWWCGPSRQAIHEHNAGNLADQSLARVQTGESADRFEEWDDGQVVHAPVGSFAPNAFGLHDVIGNVWEWCRDLGGDIPTASDRAAPRAFRGGSFSDKAELARSAYRDYSVPDFIHSGVGVRAARALTP